MMVTLIAVTLVMVAILMVIAMVVHYRQLHSFPAVMDTVETLLVAF